MAAGACWLAALGRAAEGEVLGELQPHGAAVSRFYWSRAAPTHLRVTCKEDRAAPSSALHTARAVPVLVGEPLQSRPCGSETSRWQLVEEDVSCRS